jgi:hypothetical protein
MMSCCQKLKSWSDPETAPSGMTWLKISCTPAAAAVAGEQAAQHVVHTQPFNMHTRGGGGAGPMALMLWLDLVI